MAEPGLDDAGGMAGALQLVAAGVAQHVRVAREGEPGRGADFGFAS